MPDRLSEIEARLARVEETVRLLSAGAPPSARLLPGAPPSTSAATAFLPASLDGTALVTLVGRTLIVLGGAYALRALTESGRVPVVAGVLAGIVYAVLWLGAADRTPAARPLSGFFHGLAAVLIGLPLLWESATHFHLLSPAVSATALAALSALGLLVAAHRRLQSLAATTVLGSLAAHAAFIVHAGPAPFAVSLLALGVGTLWLAEARRWRWLPWLPALSADLLFGGLIGRAAAAPPRDAPAMVLVLEIALAGVYLSAVVWRTLVGRGRIRPFDVVQVALSVAVGLGGALVVAPRAMPHGGQALVVGLILALAAGAYGAAFGIFQARREQAGAFSFHATVAVVLVIAGIGAAMTAGSRVLVFGALTAAAMALGARFSQPMLSLHGAIYNVSAAVSSGLLFMAIVVWLAPSGWPALTWAELVVFAITLVCGALRPALPTRLADVRPLPWAALAARLILAMTLVVSTGGLLVRLSGFLLGNPPANAGALASVRTATLSGAALVVAALGRSRRFVEFGWFVYPVLVVGAIKLVVDDFPHSTAGALFVALAAYGIALVLAPKILRQRKGR